MISLQGKTNFFEKKVAEYAKAGVAVRETADGESAVKKDGHAFTLEEDF